MIGRKRIERGRLECHPVGMTNGDAYVLRENTGTSGVLQTALAAVSTLKDHNIPHLIVGGFAVLELGCPRVRIDVNIVVPDILEAVEWLTADLSGPFARVAACEDRVEDPRNGVKVDLLPAGRVLKRGRKVPFPQPTKATGRLQIVPSEQRISLKPDSWANSPNKRLRDKADVVELVTRRLLPRDLAVAPSVRNPYTETWDALQSES
jgi:hypothetical protein